MRVLLDLSAKADQLTADFAVLKAENAIKDSVATARAAGLTALPPADQERFLKDYERIVEAGYAQNPVVELPAGPKRRGRRKQSKAPATCLTASATTLTASSPSCGTSRRHSTTISRSVICE